MCRPFESSRVGACCVCTVYPDGGITMFTVRCVLVALVFGSIAEAQPPPKAVPGKESVLLKDKGMASSIETIAGFPWSKENGMDAAEKWAILLNAFELFLKKSEKEDLAGRTLASSVVDSTLNEAALTLALAKLRMRTAGLPKAAYRISWNAKDGKWVVEDVPLPKK